MPQPGHKITKTEVTSSEVSITLANGVTIHLSSNPGYLHIDFSGIKELPEGHLLKASGYHHAPKGLPSLPLANYVDISYLPSREY
jgi:hypothetical protein